MMAKFFLGIAIIAFTTFLGYLCSKKYRKRKNFFTQWTSFNERFLNEIAYYRRPLQDFFMKYTYKEEFAMLLDRFLQAVKNGIPLHDYLLSTPDFDFLKKEEKQGVENYFSVLGKGDSSSQKSYFSAQKQAISEWEKHAKDTAKKYGDLYVKLGFLCGLLILILIL